MTAALDAQTLRTAASLWQQQKYELTTSFLGESMLPSIAPGDAVRLRFTREVAPGDVVLFIWRGHLGLHRAIAVSERWVLTRGDNNRLPDPPLQRNEVLARVLDAPPAPASRFVDRLTARAMRTSPRLGTLMIRALLLVRQLFVRGRR